MREATLEALDEVRRVLVDDSLAAPARDVVFAEAASEFMVVFRRLLNEARLDPDYRIESDELRALGEFTRALSTEADPDVAVDLAATAATICGWVAWQRGRRRRATSSSTPINFN